MEKIKTWVTVIAVLIGLGVFSIGFANKDTVSDLDRRVTVIETEMGHIATKEDLTGLKTDLALVSATVKRIEETLKGRN